MSEKGLDFSLQETLGSNKNLLVFYNFSGMSGRHLGNELDDSLNYAVIENCEPAVDTGVYSGVLVGAGGTIPTVTALARSTFLLDDTLNLSGSNVKVTGTNSLPYNDCSVAFDFEFKDTVDNSVLFGSLEKTSQTINGQVITGAKGFNFGVTDRGQLFYQGFDQGGDFIKTSSSFELSKRNVISFSLGSNQLSVCRFDYLNNEIQKEDFTVNTSSIANNEEFYIGGSNQYFRKGAAGCSGEFGTASGINVHSFCLLSGYVAPSVMFSLGSGLVGDYFTSTQPLVEQRRITGYNQIIKYQTGITGYDYENTGSINIQTGRYMETGNIFADDPTGSNVKEGDRYFIYRTFDSALSASGVKNFVKEQVGYLHPQSGYQYLPTGDGAFDTLGLQNVEGAVSDFIEQKGISGAGTISVKLFGSRFQVGSLDKISGVIQEPLYETIESTPKGHESGVKMGGLSVNFKKNYIYYLGERI
mgnify:FL=1|tara:strand:- start:1278 stop:2693 length:1416 start_codon:yes stop_codon:yes gene_type:complete